MSVAIQFPYTLSKYGIVDTTEDSNQIYLDRVLTLLSTNLGQRPMLPTYGVDWSTSLFENENNAKAAIPAAIISAVSRWIPDVEVKKIDIKDNQDGIENVLVSLKLPDNTIATLPVSTATFKLDGTVVR
jgi:phage baseplate assembly protein W